MVAGSAGPFGGSSQWRRRVARHRRRRPRTGRRKRRPACGADGVRARRLGPPRGSRGIGTRRTRGCESRALRRCRICPCDTSCRCPSLACAPRSPEKEGRDLVQAGAPVPGPPYHHRFVSTCRTPHSKPKNSKHPKNTWTAPAMLTSSGSSLRARGSHVASVVPARLAPHYRPPNSLSRRPRGPQYADLPEVPVRHRWRPRASVVATGGAAGSSLLGVGGTAEHFCSALPPAANASRAPSAPRSWPARPAWPPCSPHDGPGRAA